MNGSETIGRSRQWAAAALRRRFSRAAMILAAVVLGLPGADEIASGPLQVLATTSMSGDSTDPPLLRAIIHNAGAETMIIDRIAIGFGVRASRSVGAHDPEVLWWTARPAHVPPAGFSEVRIKMRQPASPRMITVGCRGGGVVSAQLADASEEPLLQSARFIDQALMVHHRGRSDPEVLLDGRSLKAKRIGALLGEVSTFTIPVERTVPGTYHLLTVSWGPGRRDHLVLREHPAFTLHLEVGEADSYRLDSGELSWGSWAPSGSAQNPPYAYLRSCFTHGQAFQIAAWDALRRQFAVEQSMPQALSGIHLCAFERDEALRGVGASADAIRLNPFALAQSGPRMLQQARDVLATARRHARFAEVHCVVPVTGPDDPLLWPRTLLAMLHGCRGIHYRQVSWQVDRDIARKLLHKRLHGLQARASLWTGAEVVGELDLGIEGIFGGVLRLDDRHLAIILLDGIADDRSENIAVPIPLASDEKVLRVVDGEDGEVPWVRESESVVSIRLAAFRDAAVVYVDLEQP